MLQATSNDYYLATAFGAGGRGTLRTNVRSTVTISRRWHPLLYSHSSDSGAVTRAICSAIVLGTVVMD